MTRLKGKWWMTQKNNKHNMTVFEKIKALLNDVEVSYETSHHAPTRTSEDSARVRGTNLHSGAKALVVRGSKTKEFYLLVMPANMKLNSKKVKQAVGESVSFAQDPQVVTGCVPGSVPPFGSAIGLKTYCDVRLADNERINFNAGSLTDSIDMRYDDYVAVERPNIVDIAE